MTERTPYVQVIAGTLLFLLLSAPGAAQDVTGAISGQVEVADRTSGSVQVIVSGRDLPGTRTVETDRDGYFNVRALPPGEYTVRFQRMGLRPVVVDSVQVQLGRTTHLATRALQSTPIQLDEQRVVADRLAIDMTSTVAGATLTPSDYAVLPGERDYKSLMSILPGVVQTGRGDPPNVNGATGLENTYFIDGMNVTGELKAESGTSLPYNFIKAVEIKTGGYEAEYGKALGAIVNAVTYTGTNDFTFNVFGFATHSSLSATPKAQPALRDRNQMSYDVGVRVGGPVVRDRLWYSGAYNPKVERSDREITGQRTFRDERVAHVFAGKLTWQSSAATTLEASVFGDPASRHAVEPMPYFASFTPLSANTYRRLIESGGVVSSLRANVVLRRMLFEASVARSHGRANEIGATPAAQNEPLLIDQIARTIDGGIGVWSTSDLKRSTIRAKTTVMGGGHTALVGAEFEDVSVFRAHGWSGGQRILAPQPNLFITSAEGASGQLHNRIPTLYAQDSWRISGGVTLNVGLRWSAQTLTGASGRTAQHFPNEWQPRLGIIWAPGANEQHRIFASAGRFYIQEPLNLSTVWFVDYPYVHSFYSTDPRAGSPIPDSVKAGVDPEANWARNLPDLQVEHSDEFVLGYERRFATWKLTARGVRRDLRSSFQWGFDPATGISYVGTPGKGDFTILPPPVRQYTALELAGEGRWRAMDYRSSYVLSHSRGNYPGLFNSDFGIANPGAVGQFFSPEHALNSTGRLPNDRTHVFKASGSFTSRFGFLLGAFVSAESGSPLNAFGETTDNVRTFTVPRGSAGRTPWLWDLNLRLVHVLEGDSKRGRLILDVLHVGDPQRPVRLVEEKFLPPVGSAPPALNTSYRRPLTFQSPMMARVGFEIDF
jgi:hypothetical protein